MGNRSPVDGIGRVINGPLCCAATSRGPSAQTAPAVASARHSRRVVILAIPSRADRATSW
jgi:hypothetical protein